MILSKHVGDCLLTATRGSNFLSFVSTEVEKSYTLTTNIEPTNFVGMTIHRDHPNRSITISQPHFVGKILYLYSVPSSTAQYPMADFLTSLKVSSDLPILSSTLQTLFQEKVGNILYLASHTRPDLIYSTTQLSRRSNKATSKDMAAVNRLLRCIASTAHLGLTFCTHSQSANSFAYVSYRIFITFKEVNYHSRFFYSC